MPKEEKIEKNSSSTEAIFQDWYANVVNLIASKRKMPSEQNNLPDEGSSKEKKRRRDSYWEMSNQNLLKLLENWRF